MHYATKTTQLTRATESGCAVRHSLRVSPVQQFPVLRPTETAEGHQVAQVATMERVRILHVLKVRDSVAGHELPRCQVVDGDVQVNEHQRNNAETGKRQNGRIAEEHGIALEPGPPTVGSDERTPAS